MHQGQGRSGRGRARHLIISRTGAAIDRPTMRFLLLAFVLQLTAAFVPLRGPLIQAPNPALHASVGNVDPYGAADKPVVRFITSNKNKAREVEALLTEGGLTLPFHLEPVDIELPELQDEPAVICIEKARLAAYYTKGPVLVEDTSLCFGALKGLPGPYIKWFLEELGNDGLWGILRGFEDKSAVAVCNVGFALGEDDDPVVFSGQTYGQIVEPDPDETDVFGWDGVFKPQGFDRKFSQMSVVEKNEISHRSLAMRALQQWVQQNQADIMQKLSSRSS